MFAVGNMLNVFAVLGAESQHNNYSLVNSFANNVIRVK